jgi:hypothetical protein
MIRAILPTIALLWCSNVCAQDHAPTEGSPKVVKPPQEHLEGEVRLGISARRFYGLESTSASATARLGVYVPQIYFVTAAGILVERGVTRGGLTTTLYGADLNIGLAFDRVRIGITPGIARYAVTRATSGASEWKLIPAASAELSVTIIKLEATAFTVNARGDWSPKALGASASLGVRF